MAAEAEVKREADGVGDIVAAVAGRRTLRVRMDTGDDGVGREVRVVEVTVRVMLLCLRIERSDDIVGGTFGSLFLLFDVSCDKNLALRMKCDECEESGR